MSYLENANLVCSVDNRYFSYVNYSTKEDTKTYDDAGHDIFVWYNKDDIIKRGENIKEKGYERYTMAENASMEEFLRINRLQHELIYNDYNIS